MFERFGNVKISLHSTLPLQISLPPYHKLVLKGYAEIVAIPEYKAWVILYGCGADWNGENRFLKLKDEVKVAIQKVKIVPMRHGTSESSRYMKFLNPCLKRENI